MVLRIDIVTRIKLAVTLLVVMVFPAMSAQIEFTRQTDGLVGKVKSVRTERVKLFKKHGKMVEGKRTLSSSDTYDEGGVLIEGTRNLLDLGILVTRNPDLLSKLSDDDPASDFIRGVMAYREEETCVYDGRGNAIEKRSYNADGILSAKGEFKYDDRGNVTEEASYGSRGLLISRNIHSYEYYSRLVTG